MTKFTFKVFVTFLLSFLFLSEYTIAQEKTEGNLFLSTKSFDYFNKVVTNRSDDTLFKLFQFKGKYQGGYRYTEIKHNGHSYTARVTPHAYQNGRRAVLSKEIIKTLKQKLLDFSLSKVNEDLKPKEGVFYSAFVFQDELNFVRLNFIGQIPKEIQDIKNFLDIEFDKAEREELKKLWAESKRLHKKYGEWEKLPGIILPYNNRFSRLKNNKKVIFSLTGHRQTLTEGKQTETLIYSVLVSYKNGIIVGGVAGNLSDDPVSRNGISWTPSKKSYKHEKQLIVKYNAIDKNLEIDGKFYKLDEGNLFVIKMDKRWTPKVRQLKIISESIGRQEILDYFKKTLNDETLEFP